ncbi:Spo73p SCDLUD_000381 [Saccharomycodes ludwigii]|uniref:Spo73p n=1 Tax=Saccharomycodes ludwigii TaxID=36035 RepID=UPI001E8AE936|nr:hypothetical protein SCDLUD_000381 [Saccharomycodes ludwigii]KAH3902790.1 hypothetical protein SCDLUD_000381 [Saccharomycodes ludwigii]
MTESPPDIIIENQRGITLLGYPIYSARLLIKHLDPPKYQTFPDLVHVSGGPKLYPLERQRQQPQTTEYKWFVSIDFYSSKYFKSVSKRNEEDISYNNNNNVLTTPDDIDEQGWYYAWNFRSENWNGKYGIVRRRFWIRLPVV